MEPLYRIRYARIPKQLLAQCNSESILLEHKVDKITDNKIISNKEYSFYIICATDMIIFINY